MLWTLMTAVGVLFNPIDPDGWVRVSGNAQLTAYAAAKPVRLGPETTRLWVLVDYAAAQSLGGARFQSVRILEEYDCRNGLHRRVALVQHAQPEGRGAIVHESRDPEGPWSPVPAGTVFAEFRVRACRAAA